MTDYYKSSAEESLRELQTGPTGLTSQVDGQKVQEVRIVYNFVGEIPEIAA